MDQELIPGLPEDLARGCLIRVPYYSFGPTRSVCRRWRTEIESPLFHLIRNLSNLSRPVIAFTQAQPPLSSGPAHKYHTPSYRLTTYDPSTATWRSLPAPIPGAGLPLFCQMAAADRKIVVIGGWDPETWAPSDSVHVYDFAASNWRRGAPMPGPKRSFFASAAASGSGRVFVAGGHDEEKNAMRTAMVYDVEGDEWAPLPDMATERDECKGVFIGGKFHVVGGYSTDAQGRFATSAEVFDVATWRWGPVEEGMLDSATCPRTCVAGEEGRMWMWRGGQVAVRDGDTWRAVGEVPDGASVVTALVRWEGKVMVVGSGSHGGAQEGYVMMTEVEGDSNGKVTWQRVEVPAEYSGHIQTSCYLEI